MKPIRIGGMPDYIHLAVGLPPTLAASKALQQIKGGSSKTFKEEFVALLIRHGIHYEERYLLD